MLENKRHRRSHLKLTLSLPPKIVSESELGKEKKGAELFPDKEIIMERGGDPHPDTDPPPSSSSVSAPLLQRKRSSSGATWAQTLGNIVVSIVGTGVLGLPYAFRFAGWAAGSLGVALAGLATCYCMLLLVSILGLKFQ